MRPNSRESAARRQDVRQASETNTHGTVKARQLHGLNLLCSCVGRHGEGGQMTFDSLFRLHLADDADRGDSVEDGHLFVREAESEERKFSTYTYASKCESERGPPQYP